MSYLSCFHVISAYCTCKVSVMLGRIIKVVGLYLTNTLKNISNASIHRKIWKTRFLRMIGENEPCYFLIIFIILNSKTSHLIG